MKKILIAVILSNVGLFSQSIQQPLLVTNIAGITSLWPGECGAGVVDNRSSVSRRNIYHSVAAQGSGTWSVTLQYSNTSCSGPWTAYGANATINQASNPAIAVAYDGPYTPASFIQIAVTGNAVANYTGQHGLYMPPAGSGSVTFPIGVSQGGTGASTVVGAKANLDISPMMASDYFFSPQYPGVSLIAQGVNQSIPMSPCPLGVNGSDLAHWLYISGGTGNAEPVLITGGTCTGGSSTGTVTVTPNYAHSGSWTIQSATSGGKEAEEVVAAAGGGTVVYGAGSFSIHGPLVIDSGNIVVSGQGMDATKLVGDLSVSPIVQFGSSAVAALSTEIRDIAVTRSTGSIPSGAIGVYWYNFGQSSQDSVHITRSDLDEVFDYPSSSLSIQFDSYNSHVDSASTAYLKVNNAAGIHFYGGELGINGAESPNPTQAVILSGNANDVRFVGTNIIPRDAGGVKTAYAVSILGNNNVGLFAFDTVHFENIGTAYFFTDSGTSQLNQIQISNSSFGDPTIQLFALNAATNLVTATITGTAVSCPITLTDPVWLTLAGNVLSGVISIAGGTNANLAMVGNTVIASATFTGAWSELSINSNTFYGGTTLNTSGASGNINYNNTFSPGVISHVLTPGAILNQGADAITSDPPPVQNSNNGWKEVYYNSAGSKEAFGLAAFTAYFRYNHFYGWGPGNPNNDGTSSSVDSAAAIAFDTNLGEIRPHVYPFSGLPGTPPSGYFVYCSDCTVAATCTGGGSGHLAISNGTNWTCQ